MNDRYLVLTRITDSRTPIKGSRKPIKIAEISGYSQHVGSVTHLYLKGAYDAILVRETEEEITALITSGNRELEPVVESLQSIARSLKELAGLKRRDREIAFMEDLTEAVKNLTEAVQRK